MYKVMAFLQLVLVCLMQVATDCMLIGNIMKTDGWHDYFVAMGMLVIVSAFGVRVTWKEWRNECNK